MRPRPLAVVLGGDALGLGIARSLHRDGVPVLAFALHAADPVRFSRCARTRLIPAAADREAALLAALLRIRDDERPVLIPGSDYFAHFVARHHDLLRHRFRCATAPRHVVETVLDKARDTELLRRQAIPLPRTMAPLPARPAELVGRLGLPIIIKPRTYRDKNELGWRNVILHEKEHVGHFYRTQRPALGRVIAQEMIPGDDPALWECIGVFDEHHELVRAFTFRKLRTVPAHYGQTSFGISERNEQVIDLARQAGRALRMVGPADVDIKFDYRDGSYRYLELNPRFGLCNWFATCSGMNVVADAYRMTIQRPLEPSAQTEGVTFLAALEDTGGRVNAGDSWWHIVRDFAAALRTRPVGSYFSWHDPLPGPGASLRLCLRVVRRALQGQLGLIFTQDYGRQTEAAREPMRLWPARHDREPASPQDRSRAVRQVGSART